MKEERLDRGERRAKKGKGEKGREREPEALGH